MKKLRVIPMPTRQLEVVAKILTAYLKYAHGQLADHNNKLIEQWERDTAAGLNTPPKPLLPSDHEQADFVARIVLKLTLADERIDYASLLSRNLSLHQAIVNLRTEEIRRGESSMGRIVRGTAKFHDDQKKILRKALESESFEQLCERSGALRGNYRRALANKLKKHLKRHVREWHQPYLAFLEEQA